MTARLRSLLISAGGIAYALAHLLAGLVSGGHAPARRRAPCGCIADATGYTGCDRGPVVGGGDALPDGRPRFADLMCPKRGCSWAPGHAGPCPEVAVAPVELDADERALFPVARCLHCDDVGVPYGCPLCSRFAGTERRA